MAITSTHNLRETATRLAYQMDTGQPVDPAELRQLLSRVADGCGPYHPMLPTGVDRSLTFSYGVD